MTRAQVEAAVINAYARPFRWGSADCCVAACDAFLALWGVDPLAPWRDRYASRVEALRLIRTLGGWRRAARTMVDRAGLVAGTGALGELGMIRAGAGAALAIGFGDDVWAARIDGGLQTVRGALDSWGVPWRR